LGFAPESFFGLGCGDVERRRSRTRASISSSSPCDTNFGFSDMPTPIPQPLTPPIITRYPPSSLLIRGVSPKVRPCHLRHIGAVVVAWAKLENSINDLIWTIKGHTLETGRESTEELQINKLLTALQNAMQEYLIGDKMKPERKAILNIIEYVNASKEERNMVVHGTWAEINSEPVVGSLRAYTPTKDRVTFEQYPITRMLDIENYAVAAVNNVIALISRLESLR
jgi:hypothetical protein